MKRVVNKWFLAAAILIVVGAIVLVGALAAVDFEFSRISTRKSETNTYEFNEDFESIFVNVETAAVSFLPSEDGVCKVEFLEEENLKHSAKVQEGLLMIDVTDSREWYDYIGLSFQTPAVRVYLPKDEYTALSAATVTGDVKVPDRYSFETVAISGTTSNISCYASVSKSIELHTTTGNITIGSTKTESIRLSATTGLIAVNDAACSELTAKNSTRRIKLNNVIAEERLFVENTTGGVEFARCDAGQITVKTSTGDVKGTILSEKIFVTDTSTGSVSVPHTTGGGKCEISTSTGDIEIKII